MLEEKLTNSLRTDRLVNPTVSYNPTKNNRDRENFMKKLSIAAMVLAFWALVAGDIIAQGVSPRPVIFTAPKLPKDPQSHSQVPVLSTTTVHAPIQLPDNRPKKEPKVDTKKNLNPQNDPDVARGLGNKR